MMSACRGGSTMPSETASAIDTTSIAPFLCAISAMAAGVLDGAEEIRRLDQDAGRV